MAYDQANAYEIIELYGLTEKGAALPIPEDDILTDHIIRETFEALLGQLRNTGLEAEIEHGATVAPHGAPRAAQPEGQEREEGKMTKTTEGELQAAVNAALGSMSATDLQASCPKAAEELIRQGQAQGAKEERERIAAIRGLAEGFQAKQAEDLIAKIIQDPALLKTLAAQAAPKADEE